MKEFHKEWQRKWRAILGASLEDIPEEIQNDYTLICDIWQANDEKLKECFSILPKGEVLFERIQQAKSIIPEISNISDGELLHLLGSINSSISTVLKEYNKDSYAIELNNTKNDCITSKIYRGNIENRRDIFNSADPLTIHLDDIIGSLIKNNLGELGEAAYYFLTEPLYMFGGNNYEVANWVLWSLIEDSYTVNPYLGTYELYNLKAKAGWSKTEMFVYLEE